MNLLLLIILCILAFIIYKENYGFILCAIGVFLNFIAITMNGNKMPVLPYHEIDYINIMQNYNKYMVLTEETRVKFLADIFKINNYIISIGDIIIAIGLFLTILILLQDISKQLRTNKGDRAF